MKLLTTALILAFALCSTAVAKETRGDVNGDDSVNISDVAYLNNFLFANGPTPNCWDQGYAEAADVNGDGAVSATDVAALIAFLYQGCGTCRATPVEVPC